MSSGTLQDGTFPVPAVAAFGTSLEAHALLSRTRARHHRTL